MIVSPRQGNLPFLRSFRPLVLASTLLVGLLPDSAHALQEVTGTFPAVESDSHLLALSLVGACFLPRSSVWLLIIGVVVLDVLTKAWVRRRLPEESVDLGQSRFLLLDPRAFDAIPKIHLANGFWIIQRLVITPLRHTWLARAIVLGVFISAFPSPLPMLVQIGLALYIGGALSQYLNVVRRGGVTDWLMYRKPFLRDTFDVTNVADASLLLGRALFYLGVVVAMIEWAWSLLAVRIWVDWLNALIPTDRFAWLASLLQAPPTWALALTALPVVLMARWQPEKASVRIRGASGVIIGEGEDRYEMLSTAHGTGPSRVSRRRFAPPDPRARTEVRITLSNEIQVSGEVVGESSQWFRDVSVLRMEKAVVPKTEVAILPLGSRKLLEHALGKTVTLLGYSQEEQRWVKKRGRLLGHRKDSVGSTLEAKQDELIIDVDVPDGFSGAAVTYSGKLLGLVSYTVGGPLFERPQTVDPTDYPEPEFPVYRNGFIDGGLKQGRPLIIVGTREQTEQVRALLQSTLFGPSEERLQAWGVSVDAIKQTWREADSFTPKDPQGKAYDLTAFVDLLTFDEAGIAQLDPTVAIRRLGGNQFEVMDGAARATVSIPPARAAMRTQLRPATRPHRAPKFGVTFLGTSTGFDEQGLTSSFVVHGNGHRLFVDPLAFSDTHLAARGMTAPEVPDVILTHVHADHDAGLVQWVLAGRRVRLLTDPIIYESFLDKVEAIGGRDFSDQVELIPLIPGRPLEFEGLRIVARRNFHPIPTIGFLIETPRGSLSYSGDTFYHPEELAHLQHRRVLTQRRRLQLEDRRFFAATLSIHENGPPPIHTRREALLPRQRERQAVGLSPLVIIHTGEDPGPEMRLARPGQTIDVEALRPARRLRHGLLVALVVLVPVAALVAIAAGLWPPMDPAWLVHPAAFGATVGQPKASPSETRDELSDQDTWSHQMWLGWRRLGLGRELQIGSLPSSVEDESGSVKQTGPSKNKWHAIGVRQHRPEWHGSGNTPRIQESSHDFRQDGLDLSIFAWGDATDRDLHEPFGEQGGLQGEGDQGVGGAGVDYSQVVVAPTSLLPELDTDRQTRKEEPAMRTGRHEVKSTSDLERDAHRYEFRLQQTGEERAANLSAGAPSPAPWRDSDPQPEPGALRMPPTGLGTDGQGLRSERTPNRSRVATALGTVLSVGVVASSSPFTPTIAHETGAVKLAPDDDIEGGAVRDTTGWRRGLERIAKGWPFLASVVALRALAQAGAPDVGMVVGRTLQPYFSFNGRQARLKTPLLVFKSTKIVTDGGDVRGNLPAHGGEGGQVVTHPFGAQPLEGREVPKVFHLGLQSGKPSSHVFKPVTKGSELGPEVLKDGGHLSRRNGVLRNSSLALRHGVATLRQDADAVNPEDGAARAGEPVQGSRLKALGSRLIERSRADWFTGFVLGVAGAGLCLRGADPVMLGVGLALVVGMAGQGGWWQAFWQAWRWTRASWDRLSFSLLGALRIIAPAGRAGLFFYRYLRYPTFRQTLRFSTEKQLDGLTALGPIFLFSSAVMASLGGGAYYFMSPSDGWLSTVLLTMLVSSAWILGPVAGMTGLLCLWWMLRIVMFAILESATFRPALEFQASVRSGRLPLRLHGRRVIVFGGKAEVVQPYSILALFLNDEELSWLRREDLTEFSGPASPAAAYGALAYIEFDIRGKTVIVTEIQSNAYRHLRRNQAAKQRYRHWHVVTRLWLAAYARRIGAKRIVSPTSEAMQERSRVAPSLADLVYDYGLKELGYILEERPTPIPWVSGLQFTRAWVKRLDTADPTLDQFEQLLESHRHATGTTSFTRGSRWLGRLWDWARRSKVMPLLVLTPLSLLLLGGAPDLVVLGGGMVVATLGAFGWLLFGAWGWIILQAMGVVLGMAGGDDSRGSRDRTEASDLLGRGTLRTRRRDIPTRPLWPEEARLVREALEELGARIANVRLTAEERARASKVTGVLWDRLERGTLLACASVVEDPNHYLLGWADALTQAALMTDALSPGVLSLTEREQLLFRLGEVAQQEDGKLEEWVFKDEEPLTGPIGSYVLSRSLARGRESIRELAVAGRHDRLAWLYDSWIGRLETLDQAVVGSPVAHLQDPALRRAVRDAAAIRRVLQDGLLVISESAPPSLFERFLRAAGGGERRLSVLVEVAASDTVPLETRQMAIRQMQSVANTLTRPRIAERAVYRLVELLGRLEQPVGTTKARLSGDLLKTPTERRIERIHRDTLALTIPKSLAGLRRPAFRHLAQSLRSRQCMGQQLDMLVPLLKSWRHGFVQEVMREEPWWAEDGTGLTRASDERQFRAAIRQTVLGVHLRGSTLEELTRFLTELKEALNRWPAKPLPVRRLNGIEMLNLEEILAYQPSRVRSGHLRLVDPTRGSASHLAVLAVPGSLIGPSVLSQLAPLLAAGFFAWFVSAVYLFYRAVPSLVMAKGLHGWFQDPGSEDDLLWAATVLPAGRVRSLVEEGTRNFSALDDAVNDALLADSRRTAPALIAHLLLIATLVLFPETISLEAVLVFMVPAIGLFAFIAVPSLTPTRWLRGFYTTIDQTVLAIRRAAATGRRIVWRAHRSWELRRRFARDRAVEQLLLSQGLFARPVGVTEQGQTRRVRLAFARADRQTAREVAGLLLAGEEATDRSGRLSQAESLMLKRHRAHFDPSVVDAIRRLLERNPWTIVATDEASGAIVGVVITALILTHSAKDLPATSGAMSRAQERQVNPQRNTVVDLWFTGDTRAIRHLMIDASAWTAQAINALQLEGLTADALYAFSNPRGLPLHPDRDLDAYVAQASDPALGFHGSHGAQPVTPIWRRDAFPPITHGLPRHVTGNLRAYALREARKARGLPVDAIRPEEEAALRRLKHQTAIGGGHVVPMRYPPERLHGSEWLKRTGPRGAQRRELFRHLPVPPRGWWSRTLLLWSVVLCLSLAALWLSERSLVDRSFTGSLLLSTRPPNPRRRFRVDPLSYPLREALEQFIGRLRTLTEDTQPLISNFRQAVEQAFAHRPQAEPWRIYHVWRRWSSLWWPSR